MNNYRSIAISCLILKVFDHVILDIHGDKLTTDEFQFGYQDNMSTSMCTWCMCTWLVVETIEYFQRHGSNVCACVTDMTKAFDNVKHSALLWELEEKGIPPIFLRLLVTSKMSSGIITYPTHFRSRTGLNKGQYPPPPPPRLFCVYTGSLFDIHRKKRTGCWIDNVFVGWRHDLWESLDMRTIFCYYHPPWMDFKKW